MKYELIHNNELKFKLFCMTYLKHYNKLLSYTYDMFKKKKKQYFIVYINIIIFMFIKEIKTRIGT